MVTSGLVLDVYDDSRGEVLRSIFPTQEALPDRVKTAHVLSASERERLPDDLFALVLIEGDRKLRKFACIDAGNTELSTAYFLKTAERLPEGARGIAAANLCEAHRWYDLKPPLELEKMALGVGTALRAFNAVPVAKGTAAAIKDNLSTVRQLEGNGHVVTPEQMRHAKMAEASGTSIMPLSAPGPTGPAQKAVVKKTAQIGRLSGHGADSGGALTTNEGTLGKAPVSAPQARQVHFVVTKEQTVCPAEKKASRCALGNKFPLDNLLQIKAAAAYFEEHGQRLAPEDRRSFCSELVKSASPLRLPLSDSVRKYGAGTYAPLVEIKLAQDMRRTLLEGRPTDRAVLDLLFEKRAELPPDLFCAALAEFDAERGLDCHYDSALYDPYFSTFGVEKQAEEFSEVIGNDMVTETSLRRLARQGQVAIKAAFTEDFFGEFRKDPVGIFKSLPRDQKILIMRMANETSPGTERPT